MSFIFALAAGCHCKILLQGAVWVRCSCVMSPFPGVAAVEIGCGAVGRGCCKISMAVWGVGVLMEMRFRQCGLCWHIFRCVVLFVHPSWRYCYFNIQKIGAWPIIYLQFVFWQNIILYGNQCPEIDQLLNCLGNFRKKIRSGLQSSLGFGSWQHHARCWGTWCVGLSANSPPYTTKKKTRFIIIATHCPH